MKLAKEVARHFREVHTGGNWTASNLRSILHDVTYEQAITKVKDLNTILTLTYHIHYYVAAVLKVLQGEPLHAKDAYSFDHPEITSQAEWETFLKKVFDAAETFAEHVEKLPEARLQKHLPMKIMEVIIEICTAS